MSRKPGTAELTPSAQRILAGGRGPRPPNDAPIWERYITAFHVDPGDVAALQAVFAMRYEVFCVDRKFLPSENYPDGLETDGYDSRSEHVLALDRAGRPAGAIRLVRSDRIGDLPFEEHCPELWAGSRISDRRTCAEISRMVIHREFRHRRDDSRPDGATAHESRPTPMPLLLLALYRQLYLISRRKGIRWWYAAMEVPHARAFAGLGLVFNAIGPVIDYYGPVAPYLADLRVVEKSLAQTQPRLLEWIQGK